MIYIFDASFVGSLVIPDEKKSQIKNLVKKIKNEDEKYSPELLWYEVTNIFRNLILRKRYTAEEVSLFFQYAADLGIKIIYGVNINYSKKIWDLCNTYNLSAYDAAYLELADRKKAILCTLDDDLINAAKKHGVKTIE